MSNIQKNFLSKLHNWVNQLEGDGKHPAFASELSIVEQAFRYVNKELEINNPKFLDIGSATGNILYAAKEIFGKEGQYCGIEHNKTYAAIANSIDHKFNVFIIDMFSKLSIEQMKDADIIYTYVPVGGQDLVKLYKLISLKAKNGAIIILNDTNMRSEYFSVNTIIKPLKRFTGSDCCNQTDITVYQKNKII